MKLLFVFKSIKLLNKVADKINWSHLAYVSSAPTNLQIYLKLEQFVIKFWLHNHIVISLQNYETSIFLQFSVSFIFK